jgi:hypothetical protein
MPIPHQTPDMRFAVAGRAERVDATHPIWTEALPMPLRRPSSAAVTHGAYFQAVRQYFQHEGVRHLQAAMAAAGSRTHDSYAPDQIEVILEKHGEFYHPARIRVADPDGLRSFVLNVAARPAGSDVMQNEIEALRQVAPRLPSGSVPGVYGMGQVQAPDGEPFCMFLADWFDNHHEFHIARDPGDENQKIVVWDTRRKPYFLPAARMAAVYAQAAYLLTRAYDPRTTRQIYPWHHAAGDFVLRSRASGVDLKLISVRQYAPTLGTGEGRRPDAESRLMAAVVFLANLTLRNRIDRLDGTGELAWAGDTAVAATVAGFKRAADESPFPDLAPLLRRYDEEDWVTLLEAVGAQYRLMPAEEALLDRHLADHAACLREAIRREYIV